MAFEIERKFLVRDHSWRGLGEAVRMVQGYLCRDVERTVRVRVAGDRAWLTVKGRAVGFSRAEFEYQIPCEDAEVLVTMCLPGLVEKTRHRIPVGGHVWEVDEFHGDNEGLVVAEIELGSEDEAFARPDWLGVEVTADARYSNSNLTKTPYSQWV